MSEWSETTLSDAIEVNPTVRLPKGTLAKKVAMEKLRPFCRDIAEYEMAAYEGGSKFLNGDTIMARITPCLEHGKCSMVSILDEGEVGFGSTEYIVFRPRPGVSDSGFVYYLVSSPIVREPAIQSMVGTSGRQRVQTDVVENLQISLPPLSTQRRIAAVLSALDDKIELNNRINANLEAQAQALFRSWFVDFEPWGGTMPEGWRDGRAEDFYDISIGRTPPRKEQEWFSTTRFGNVIWVSIANMGNCGTFISDSSEYLTQEAVRRFHMPTVPPNTVLLSFKLTIGRVAITDCETTTNEAIARFEIRDERLREYTYLRLKNYNYGDLGSTSSIAEAVNSRMIRQMPFVFPDQETISKFHIITVDLFDAIRANQRQTRILAALRDTLLPKLMSGEIDVSQVEIPA